jgi:hypothetical protein
MIYHFWSDFSFFESKLKAWIQKTANVDIKERKKFENSVEMIENFHIFLEVFPTFSSSYL